MHVTSGLAGLHAVLIHAAVCAHSWCRQELFATCNTCCAGHLGGVLLLLCFHGEGKLTERTAHAMSRAHFPDSGSDRLALFSLLCGRNRKGGTQARRCRARFHARVSWETRAHCPRIRRAFSTASACASRASVRRVAAAAAASNRGLWPGARSRAARAEASALCAATR